MRDQGLPVLCDDPNVFVPLTRAWSFFDAAARREDPAMGWLVGAYVGDHNLNISLLRQLETAPTLLLALQRLVKMASAEASHIQLGIRERRNDIVLYTRYSVMTEHPGYSVSQAYQLGVLLDLIRHFLGRRWVPDEIGVTCMHIRPSAQKLFSGSRTLVRQPMAYIAVPRSCLHLAAFPKHARGATASGPVLAGDFDFVECLRALLAAYLSEGYPSARIAAGLMGISERTLVRRLSARGLTYGALVDEVRFEAARKLLQEEDLPVGEVARCVGFGDQSHFTRMFRRIGGLCPREFRAARKNESKRAP
jgi:AraC-like DNA-binding protein